MTARDPRRLLDARSGVHPNLRALLQSGRDDLPSAERLAAIAQRFSGDIALPNNAEAVATAGANSSALPLLMAGLLLTGLGGAVYLVLQSTADAPAPSHAVDRDSHAAAAPQAPNAVTNQLATPRPDLTVPVNTKPRVAMTRLRRPERPREVIALDPIAELALLDAAQSALQTSPELALARAEQHAARYPHGQYEQEREIIAIDALLRLGHDTTAEQRAARFLAHFPGSGYAARARRQLESARATRDR